MGENETKEFSIADFTFLNQLSIPQHTVNIIFGEYYIWWKLIFEQVGGRFDLAYSFLYT